MAAYKDGQEVFHVVFDATGSSSNTDWMSCDKLLYTTVAGLDAQIATLNSYNCSFDRLVQLLTLYQTVILSLDWTELKAFADNKANFTPFSQAKVTITMCVESEMDRHPWHTKMLLLI